MANLNKQLKKLFHDYLDRKENEKLHPNVEHKSYQPKLFGSEFSGVIYFYEWSDVSRTPRTFYSLEKFEDFLESSNLFLLGWQREVIKNMHNPYISCKKGERELVIKVSYEQLKAALNNNNQATVPYQVAITRPRMVFEPDSRYPDMMSQQQYECEFWDW